MMLLNEVERAYYHLIGIRKEYPKLNPLAAGLMELGIVMHVLKHHSIIDGQRLPREGAAILTGNHCSKADPYEAGMTGRRAGRLIRTVLKKSLVVEGAYESPEYLKSIGDKEDPTEYSPLNAFVMRGIGSIPILRDKPGRDFIRICSQALDSNQLVGIFLQSTRDEEGFLRNVEPGAAFLATRKKYHETPVYPLAFSANKVTILPPFTYNQLRNQLGREIEIPELTIIIADRISDALSGPVQTDWQNRREDELARLLTTSRR